MGTIRYEIDEIEYQKLIQEGYAKGLTKKEIEDKHSAYLQKTYDEIGIFKAISFQTANPIIQE